MEIPCSPHRTILVASTAQSAETCILTVTVIEPLALSMDGCVGELKREALDAYSVQACMYL